MGINLQGTACFSVKILAHLSLKAYHVGICLASVQCLSLVRLTIFEELFQNTGPNKPKSDVKPP